MSGGQVYRADDSDDTDDFTSECVRLLVPLFHGWERGERCEGVQDLAID